MEGEKTLLLRYKKMERNIAYMNFPFFVKLGLWDLKLVVALEIRIFFFLYYQILEVHIACKVNTL